jgi:hypothetical protein
MRNLRLFITGFIVFIFLALSAFAQVQSVTMAELTGEAELVAIARVQDMRCEWNDDKSRIFTRVTLSVDECLKGDQAMKSVEILNPGGEVDGVGELYSHTAKFAPEEEVLIFIKKDKSDNLRVCRGINGKIPIKVHPVSKQLMIKNQPLETVKQDIKKLIETETK